MNNKILEQRREKEAELEQKQADDEASLLHSRREDFLRLTEARKEEEQRRRESMVGRGVAACQQREAAQRMEQEHWEAETDALLFRHYMRNQRAEGEADDARRARESLAGRLDEWRAQRTTQEAQRDAQDQEERGLLESKRDNWIDANEHKKALDQKRRESLAFRLDEWRAHKQVAEKESGERAEAERIEWELKQQEAEDVATYRQACDRSRRESLAMRLEKARQDRTVEEALREQQAIIEAEELRLRAEDHAAVAKYHADCDAARRQSMAFRNRMAVRRGCARAHFVPFPSLTCSLVRASLSALPQHLERVKEQERRDQQRAIEDEQNALSVAGWRDARAADEAAKAQARRDLAEKLVEDRKHHEHDLRQHQAALEALHDELQVRLYAPPIYMTHYVAPVSDPHLLHGGLQVRHSNWQDDQRAAEADRSRRRQSTSMRLDSWRRERMVDEMLQSQEQLMADEDARLRAQDWEDLEAAKASLKMEERLDRLKGVFFN